MEDRRIAGLARALAARPARRVEVQPGVPTAAVALVLRPGAAGPELLLIRRAERQGDPWSGHMALPGGRTDPADAGPAATAARETREEVGIDVEAHGRQVGALDVLSPMGGRSPRIVVSPFVFAVPPGTPAHTSAEVALALWVPLEELTAPGCATEYLHRMNDGTVMSFPAYGARGHVVWGMTHRILTGFLELYAQADHAADLHDGAAGALARRGTPIPDSRSPVPFMPREPFTLQLTERQAEALRALAALEELPPEVYAEEVLVKHLYHAYTPEVARRAAEARDGRTP